MKTVERFETYFSKGDGCWEWQGALSDTGYGSFRVTHTGKSRSAGAHRVSYRTYVGVIPDGDCVLHRCDNKLCVNPGHLFTGTRADNMIDKVAKGRQTVGSLFPHSKLTETSVAEMRRRYAGGERVGRLAKEFGVSSGTASVAIHRKTWRHVP